MLRTPNFAYFAYHMASYMGRGYLCHGEEVAWTRGRARRREHQITRFLRHEGVPAFHTDVFDIIIYILGEWYGIELKENHRREERWNLTVHTKTWKNQMELAEKQG
ncbi:hypothetical protein E3J74_04910 [Candidatus Bathyarchaeota archaeon]|nr:MAG: hypothetical protein E3J74_04910 [Candidatus Bathyarchaeota archaeon]